MLDSMKELVDVLLEGIIKLLPTSPFSEFIEELGNIPYVAYINWFIPIGRFVTIGVAWLSAISIYYMLMILLRWIRAID